MGRMDEYSFFLLPLLIMLLLRGTAYADVITGRVELTEQEGRSNNTSSEGLTSVGRSTYYFQRYNIDYNNPILPQLYLRAGMRAEKHDLNSETDGIKSKLAYTLLMPSVGLTLSNPFVVAGVGYDERDEKTVSGGSTVRLFRDTQNAFLGFRPEGLPTLDLLYTGQKRYDADRTSRDEEDRLFSLNSMYRPARSVQLYYNASYDDYDQHLTQSETKTLSQSARASYGDRFFDDRMVFSTNLNITRQDIQFTTAGAGGTIQVQLFPVAGLSAINDLPTIGVLTANPALIDGNLTASSGMNIGQTPSLGGDTKKRNAGLDFGLAVDVSTLFVWVDRSLPAEVTNSFMWEIYISSDNQNWSLYQTVFPAVFSAFNNRFEISFASVSTRYIMVATRPLSVGIIPPPGTDVSNIYITELQAFFNQAVSLTAGITRNTVMDSQSSDVNARYHLIRSDRHALMYDLYYLSRTTDQTGQPITRASTFTNALLANERFNRVITGNAKVMRQYNEFAGGGTLTYDDYEAALLAAMNSLPKLSHLAVVSGRREHYVERRTTKDTGTFSLNNTAEVYPGINAYLGAIENLISTMTDSVVKHNESTTLSFGTEIVPRKSLTVTLNYDWTETRLGGSGENDALSAVYRSRRQSLFTSVAYNPYSSLYLYGSLQRIDETGKPGTTNGYFSGSWSAQRTGGALELRFIYSDNIETDNRTRTRNYGPSARWKINASSMLEVTYMIASIDTTLVKTESSALNTTFKMIF
jgi:hypothetical protein